MTIDAVPGDPLRTELLDEFFAGERPVSSRPDDDPDVGFIHTRFRQLLENAGQDLFGGSGSAQVRIRERFVSVSTRTS